MRDSLQFSNVGTDCRAGFHIQTASCPMQIFSSSTNTLVTSLELQCVALVFVIRIDLFGGRGSSTDRCLHDGYEMDGVDATTDEPPTRTWFARVRAATLVT